MLGRRSPLHADELLASARAPTPGTCSGGADAPTPRRPLPSRRRDAARHRVCSWRGPSPRAQRSGQESHERFAGARAEFLRPATPCLRRSEPTANARDRNAAQRGTHARGPKDARRRRRPRHARNFFRPTSLRDCLTSIGQSPPPPISSILRPQTQRRNAFSPAQGSLDSGTGAPPEIPPAFPSLRLAPALAGKCCASGWRGAQR